MRGVIERANGAGQFSPLAIDRYYYITSSIWYSRINQEVAIGLIEV